MCFTNSSLIGRMKLAGSLNCSGVRENGLHKLSQVHLEIHGSSISLETHLLVIFLSSMVYFSQQNPRGNSVRQLACTGLQPSIPGSDPFRCHTMHQQPEALRT